MKMSLIATTTCAALVIAVAPANAVTTIDVPIKIKNCQSCLIYASSTARAGGAYLDQTVRLRKGAGVLRVPSRVSNFQVHIRKGEWYAGAPNSAALIVMA